MRKNLLLLVSLLFVSVGTLLGQELKEVTGVVISKEDNLPIISASVFVKGTKVGTVTDEKGNFKLTNLPSNAKFLIVSYIGMKDEEVAIKSGKMRIVLGPDSEKLNEVVVTGMSQTDKRLFTGATDQLKADKVKIDGMADISRGLEGRAAGVSIQNVSGTFGTAPKIRVRGATSIYGSSKPLWVVDGVIQDNVVDVGADALSSGDALTLVSSAIAGLNPDDIESFQILKDGSATSIYGAKAMAGVIVITTKKGKKGVSSINYTGEYTYRLIPSYNTFNIMNSQDQMRIYQELEEKGWLNYATVYRAPTSGVYGKMFQLTRQYDPITKQFALENTPEARARYLREAEMRNTDWFQELFNHSVMMNHSVSMSTGSDKSTSYISLSMMNDPGWMRQSKVSRYTANLNNTYNFTKSFSFTGLANVAYRTQTAPGTVGQQSDAVGGSVSRNFDINPYSYALNTSRTLDPNEYYTRNFAPFNIKHELNNNYIELDVVDLKFQGELKWRHKSGLQLSALGAVKYSSVSQRHMIKDFSNQALAFRAMGDATIIQRNSWLYTDPDKPNELPQTVLPKGGFYNTSHYSLNSYDFRTTATYNKSFLDTHIVNLFGGMEINQQDRSSDGFDGVGMQYDNGELPFVNYFYFKQLVEKNSNYYGLSHSNSRQVAFFGTGTYSYKGRYTFTGTVRYEGTNRLGKSRTARWLPTWNIATAWNMHEESWFHKLQPALSHLSLKASYSLTADAGPSSVANSTVIISSFNPWRPQASVKESGLIIDDLENSDLTYEKKHELNLGIDLGLLDNRVNFTADWYKRNNFDLIGWITTQGAGGQVNRLGNVASMQSSGLEFTLSTKNVKTKDFSWTTDFIFGYSQTKITKLKTRNHLFGLIRGGGFALEGYPHRSLFSIPFKGLNDRGLPTFEMVDEAGNHIDVNNTNYSDINFQQLEHLDYLKYEGPADPTINGSFGNIFTYKNWKLNVFITYSAGNVLRLDPIFSSSYSDLDASAKDFKNRWVVPGDERTTTVPVIASRRDVYNSSNLFMGYNAYNYSTERVASGSFVRMKEISLTYSLPSKLLKKSVLKSASLKLQGTNLFLIYADKKLNGQDPEFFRSGGVSAPVPQQFTFTVRLGF